MSEEKNNLEWYFDGCDLVEKTNYEIDKRIFEGIKEEIADKLISVTYPNNTYNYISVIKVSDIDEIINKYFEKKGIK